jgi:soluble lytic murein transglycosylase-like protein
MRFWIWLFAVISLSSVEASAQVKLVIRSDGSKAIYNVGTTKSRSRTVDLSRLARFRDRMSVYEGLIQKYAAINHVDPVLVKAVIQVESDFDPACVSRKGARGLMQLMPETAQRFNVKRVHDPEENIRGGVEYLSLLLTMFSNDLSKALAAYNAGENAVLKYGGTPPYEETETYVKRALSVYYGRAYGSSGGGRIVVGAGKKLNGGFKTAAKVPSLASAVGTAALVPSEVRMLSR